MVSLSDLFCQRHLASDAAQRFGAGKAVSFLEARDLGLSVGGDHDDFVDALVYAGFEEERARRRSRLRWDSCRRLACQSAIGRVRRGDG